MENMKNRSVRSQSVRTNVTFAIMFLAVGLSLGSGAVLCILQIAPIAPATIYLFSWITVVLGVLMAGVSALSLWSIE